jgi:hypothetical protein
MASLTPEQSEAYDALDAAVTRAMDVSGSLRDGEHVTSWAVIAHMQRPEDDGESNYGTCFPRGEMPTHAAYGLFRLAADLALHGNYEGDD